MGASGLKVSSVGLGCNNFGQRIEQSAVTAVVGAALDAGVNFFDTADTYGGQRSEALLGQALGKRRGEIVLATKFGHSTGPRQDQQGGSRSYVVSAVEASLKRLGTDYIDLYQMHVPDPHTPIEETLRALDDLIVAGKIHYIGCSKFNAWQIADADWTARHYELNRFVTAQNHYSLLERTIEVEVIPACRKFGLGLLPYFPLASGLLTGKYRRGEPPPEDMRLANWGDRGVKALRDQNFDRVEVLAGYAEARGRTLLELAFAWLLSEPITASVIAGATRAEQVNANVAAANWRLTGDERAEIAALAGPEDLFLMESSGRSDLALPTSGQAGARSRVW